MVENIMGWDWQMKIGSPGEVVQGVDEIIQSINIILKTPKGSVPLRPDFGSDLYKCIDKPIHSAIPILVHEIIESLTKWESRIEVKRVIPITEGSTLRAKIECRLIKTGKIITPEVEI